MISLESCYNVGLHLNITVRSEHNFDLIHKFNEFISLCIHYDISLQVKRSSCKHICLITKGFVNGTVWKQKFNVRNLLVYVSRYSIIILSMLEKAIPEKSLLLSPIIKVQYTTYTLVSVISHTNPSTSSSLKIKFITLFWNSSWNCISRNFICYHLYSYVFAFKVNAYASHLKMQ